jgi:hypothetical protein
MRRMAVISPGQIGLVLEDEEEAMRIAQAIADLTGKRVTLIDANGLELGTVKGHGKPSRTNQARQVVEEYASDQREIPKGLHKQLH